MKKFLTTTSMMVLVLSFFLIAGCGEAGDAGAPADVTTTTAVEGGGGEVNLLSMLPDSASAVIFVNFKEVSKLEFFDKMIKEPKDEPAEPGEMFKDYQDFVNKTGIDPQKDIYSMAVAVLGKLGPGDPDAVMVANLNYDKDKIMAILKQENVEFIEEMYKGITVRKVKEEGKEDAFAFINDSFIAGGKISGVKQVIDLSKGEGRNIMANAKLKPYIQKFSGLISFVVDFPEDAKKVHNTPMGGTVDLTQAEVIVGDFNYSGDAYSGEIALVCPNQEANNQMVTVLNGLKGMGGMMGPEVGELLAKINIAAAADKVTMSFDIPEALLKKVQEKMKQKKGMGGQTTPVQ
jgi:hypothetical protein